MRSRLIRSYNLTATQLALLGREKRIRFGDLLFHCIRIPVIDTRQRQVFRARWTEGRLSRSELHERTGFTPNGVGVIAGADACAKVCCGNAPRRRRSARAGLRAAGSRSGPEACHRIGARAGKNRCVSSWIGWNTSGARARSTSRRSSAIDSNRGRPARQASRCADVGRWCERHWICRRAGANAAFQHAR